MNPRKFADFWNGIFVSTVDFSLDTDSPTIAAQLIAEKLFFGNDNPSKIKVSLNNGISFMVFSASFGDGTLGTVIEEEKLINSVKTAHYRAISAAKYNNTCVPG